MSRVFYLSGVVLLAAVLGLSYSSADLIEPLDPLVPWDYNAMFVPAEQVLQKRYKVRELSSRLLAWHVMVNDRGLKVEAGLLWFRYRTRDIQSWALADVYRHPDKSSDWSLSAILDSPWQPLRVFSAPPTNQEVYEFGAEHWTFGAPPVFFKYLRAHVCDHAWREAIGSRPTKRYPGERN